MVINCNKRWFLVGKIRVSFLGFMNVKLFVRGDVRFRVKMRGFSV